jgi:hypothetical protein
MMMLGLCIALSWVYLAIVRTIYFICGYDVPELSDLEEHDLKHSNDYIAVMISEKNSSSVGLYNVALAIATFIIWIVQVVLGSLWNWSPIAVLLPIAVVMPFVIAYYARQYNRRIKSERREIMNKLSGNF